MRKTRASDRAASDEDRPGFEGLPPIIGSERIPPFHEERPMGISVQCTCGKELRARDSHAGKSAPCPGCGRTLLIPAQLPEVARPAMSRMASDEAEPDRA